MNDRIWLWTHAAGSHNGRYNLPDSQITPSEAARFMGIDNVVMVVFDNRPTPPFAPHARKLAGVIFLAGNLCDLNVAGVEYVRSRSWE